jgi:hypothetical protein
MKTLVKILKILVIIVVAMVAIVYGGVFLGHKVIFRENGTNTPTIQAVSNDTLTFGSQVHSPQPQTIDEFVPVLARQLKRYNEVAPDLWPNNALGNQSLIVEDYRNKRFWQIEPDGTISPLSKKDIEGYGSIRTPYVDGFKPFEGGMYLALVEDDLNNYLVWEKYLHLGTYDPFITFSHEGFHGAEQIKWQTMDNVPNGSRDEFLENTAARAKRALLQKQLLKAVGNPDDTQLILDALATYEDWKVQYPEDYRNSVYFDRIEGTAFYYELVSSLYSAYPEQVKSKDDLDRALALLATRDDRYIEHGLVTEAYNVGGFSGILLDRVQNDWKEQLMRDPQATTIDMLYQHFKDETLPAPVQLTQAEIDVVAKEIEDSNAKASPARLFRFLYDMLF